MRPFMPSRAVRSGRGCFKVCGKPDPGAACRVLVERKTRFVVLYKIDGCTSDHALVGFTRQMKKLPAFLPQSMTCDRGSEMACHTELGKRLKLDIWFCDPHAPSGAAAMKTPTACCASSCQRMLTSRKVSQIELNDIARLMNGRPRKTLNWKTPTEVLTREDKKFALTVVLDP